MDQIDEKIKMIKEIFESSGWQVIQENKLLTTKKKFLLDSDIPCFLASGFVNQTPEKLINEIYHIYDNIDNLKVHNPEVIHYEIIQESDKTRICYHINQLQWPLWPRDLVYLQTVKKEENYCGLYMFSIDSENHPIDNKKYVRTILTLSAYIIKPQNEGSMLHRIIHLDPCGSIPVTLMNKYVDKVTNVIKYFQEMYP